MKVLISSKYSTYTKGSVGGAETSMRLLAEKLSSAGHEVYYMSRGTVGFKIEKKKINGVYVILYPHISLPKRSKAMNGKANFVYNGYQLINRLKRSFIKRLNRYMLNRAVRTVNSKNLDIVYVYYETVMMRYFTQLRKKKELRYKIVLRMAGLHWLNVVNSVPKSKAQYEKLFNRMDSFNYISEGIRELTRNEFDRYGMEVKSGKELVCDIGVDSDVMKKCSSESLERPKKNGTYKILCISRFSSHQKRQDILLEAIGVIGGREKFSVTFIGEGEQRDRFIENVQELNLENIVSVKNYMSQDRLWNEMRSADLLCHPCDYEGLSKIIVESMMLGLPVLASNVLPINGYISEGVNGFLADNRAIEWAERIMEISDLEEGSLKKIKHTAQKFATENFDAEKNVQLYEKHFSELLASEN